LVRSAGSVGANYIEANESQSRKDFIMRVKISKKEVKESKYRLNLSSPIQNYERDRIEPMRECDEVKRIFAAIMRNTTV